MNIMFIPDARKGNLYQTNLLHSLSKHGDSIYFNHRGIIKYIYHDRPDILHMHWPNYFMIADNKYMTIIKSTYFICELLILKLFGTKIIWTVHNISGHESRFKYIELLFNKLLSRLCDKLIVHCPSAREEVEKIYGKNLAKNIVVIPHGNYIGYYENTITRLDARDKLNIGEQDIVFLYFGQIRLYKGVLELIDTFRKLNCERAYLFIVGKPINKEIADDIYNHCKNNDHIKNILEFIPDKDIQLYMNAADVVVLPYKDILTSGTAILSMSFGKPIIAPAVRCIAETLDERGSFLYTEDNLFNAMRCSLNTDKETLLNMGKHNFGLAERLEWDEIGKMTYNVYRG